MGGYRVRVRGADPDADEERALRRRQRKEQSKQVKLAAKKRKEVERNLRATRVEGGDTTTLLGPGHTAQERQGVFTRRLLDQATGGPPKATGNRRADSKARARYYRRTQNQPDTLLGGKTIDAKKFALAVAPGAMKGLSDRDAAQRYRDLARWAQGAGVTRLKRTKDAIEVGPAATTQGASVAGSSRTSGGRGPLTPSQRIKVASQQNKPKKVPKFKDYLDNDPEIIQRRNDLKAILKTSMKKKGEGTKKNVDEMSDKELFIEILGEKEKVANPLYKKGVDALNKRITVLTGQHEALVQKHQQGLTVQKRAVQQASQQNQPPLTRTPFRLRRSTPPKGTGVDRAKQRAVADLGRRFVQAERGGPLRSKGAEDLRRRLARRGIGVGGNQNLQRLLEGATKRAEKTGESLEEAAARLVNTKLGRKGGPARAAATQPRAAATQPRAAVQQGRQTLQDRLSQAMRLVSDHVNPPVVSDPNPPVVSGLVQSSGNELARRQSIVDRLSSDMAQGEAIRQQTDDMIRQDAQQQMLRAETQRLMQDPVYLAAQGQAEAQEQMKQQFVNRVQGFLRGSQLARDPSAQKWYGDQARELIMTQPEWMSGLAMGADYQPTPWGQIEPATDYRPPQRLTQQWAPETPAPGQSEKLFVGAAGDAPMSAEANAYIDNSPPPPMQGQPMPPAAVRPVAPAQSAAGRPATPAQAVMVPGFGPPQSQSAATRPVAPAETVSGAPPPQAGSASIDQIISLMRTDRAAAAAMGRQLLAQGRLTPEDLARLRQASGQ